MFNNRSAARWALGIATTLAFAAGARADVVYLNMLNPLPGNVPSYGYAANGIDEQFDRVTLAAGGRYLQSITLTLSDFALYSTYANNPMYSGNTTGYNQALTVDFYDGATGMILLGTDTLTTLVPWRPETTPNCANDTANPKGYGPNCYHGIAFNVTFDFTGQNIRLPDDVYFGLAFNTQVHGDSPTGTDGPYNSLNLGTGPGATIGTDDASYMTNVSARIVTNAVGNVPEPSTVALFGIAMVGLVAASRRRTRRAK